jgi:TPR repeat protein
MFDNRSISLLKKAVENGYWCGSEEYLKIITSKECEEIDYQKETEDFKRMIEEGINSDLTCRYAEALKKGDFGNKDPDEAMKYYKLVIIQGNWFSQPNYFQLFKERYKQNINQENELYDLENTAMAGAGLLSFKYAKYLEKGDIWAINLPKAMKYYLFAHFGNHRDGFKEYKRLKNQGVLF